MKRILITAVLLMLLLSLGATVLEDSIKEMLTMGRYTTIDGDNVFMSSTYWSDKGYGESGAYDFVTFASFYFLAVYHDWDTVSSSIKRDMSNADFVACPITNGYGAALLSIPLSAVYDEFGYDTYDEMGEEDLLEAIEDFIHTNGDRDAMNFEEEEDY